MDDDALIAYWTDYLRATGSGPKSIRNRTIALRAMIRRTGKALLTITRHDLIRDLARPGLQPASRQNYKSLYHGFFTWMQDEEFRTDNPGARLPKVRVPKQEPNPVTTEDIEFLLHSGIYRRTRMWVLLYAYQGFRAVEIAAVSGDSIDYDRRRILSKDGKGGKEVWRPIHDLVWDELQKWPRTGWLFPSPRREGEHVTSNNVSRVLSDALRRAGIEHRPHHMRAWYATELIDAGASTAVVAAALRHSTTQTVEKYALVRSQAITDAQAVLPRVRVPERSGRRRAA
jgi:integrase/recombinase XerD